MRMTTTVVMTLLVGCSAAPRQYAQGVPVAPSAPAFNPTWDAPITTGQPGYVGPVENLPRSHHGRVLPETPATRKESVIWAAKEPEHEGSTVSVLGELLELPATDPQRDGWAAIECADRVDHGVMSSTVLHRAVDYLKPEERGCLGARAFAECLERLRAKSPKTSVESIGRVHSDAVAEARRLCGKVPNQRGLYVLLEQIRPTLDTPATGTIQ